MSAFVVNSTHINALVTFAIAHNLTDGLNADYVGLLLTKENIASVEHRYPEEKTPVGTRRHVSYRHRESTITDPIVIIKAVDCWQYQTCETDDHMLQSGWKISEKIRAKAIELLIASQPKTESIFAANGTLDPVAMHQINATIHKSDWIMYLDGKNRLEDNEMGQVLADEIVEWLNFQSAPPMIKYANYGQYAWGKEKYTYPLFSPSVKPQTLIAMMTEYQSRIDDGFSQAWEISNAILDTAINKLPEYDQAPWGIS